ALTVGRFDPVAADVERRLVGEWIDAGAVRIGHQKHVGGFDSLPAGDRGTVERMSIVELILREHLRRHLDVLLLAACVGEPEVDELDLLVLEHLQYIGRGSHAFVSCGTSQCIGIRRKKPKVSEEAPTAETMPSPERPSPRNL